MRTENLGLVTGAGAIGDRISAASTNAAGATRRASLEDARPGLPWAEAVRLLPYLLLGVTLVLCALLLYPLLEAVPVHVWKNYNEGWNAYHAVHAIAGDDIYPALDDLVTNNYPPVSFFVVGLVSNFLGDPIVAGRVVSVLALLIVALNVVLIINREAHGWVTAAFFGCTFLAYCGSLFSTYVGMNDPAWLAHAVMTSGFVIFLYGQDRARYVALAAVVMVVAGLIKHNLLPLPLAVTIWLFFNNRRLFTVWLASALIASAISLVMLFTVFGTDLFYSILISPRVYSLDKAIAFVNRVDNYGLLVPGLICFAVTMGLFVTTIRDARVWLFFLYLLLSVVMSVAILPAAGIGHSALFDPVISAVCLLGICLNRLARSIRATYADAIVAAAMIVIIVPVMVMAPHRVQGADGTRKLLQMEMETALDIAYIRDRPGKIICENLSLCFWAGKPFAVDFFMSGQKMRAGVIDQIAFITRIENGDFALIQLMQNGQRRLPHAVEAAIARSYAVVRTSSNGLFLAPNPATSGVSGLATAGGAASLE